MNAVDKDGLTGRDISLSVSRIPIFKIPPPLLHGGFYSPLFSARLIRFLPLHMGEPMIT